MPPCWPVWEGVSCRVDPVRQLQSNFGDALSKEDVRVALIESHGWTKEANREFLRRALTSPESVPLPRLVRYGGTWTGAGRNSAPGVRGVTMRSHSTAYIHGVCAFRVLALLDGWDAGAFAVAVVASPFRWSRPVVRGVHADLSHASYCPKLGTTCCITASSTPNADARLRSAIASSIRPSCPSDAPLSK